jgi:hypothetical protein
LLIFCLYNSFELRYDSKTNSNHAGQEMKTPLQKRSFRLFNRKAKKIAKVAIIHGFGAISDPQFNCAPRLGSSDLSVILGENPFRAIANQQSSYEYYVRAISLALAFAKNDPEFKLYVLGTSGEIITIKAIIDSYQIEGLIVITRETATTSQKWVKSRKIEQSLIRRGTVRIVKMYTDKKWVGIFKFLQCEFLTRSAIEIVGIDRLVTDAEKPKIIKIWCKAIFQTIFGTGRAN